MISCSVSGFLLYSLHRHGSPSHRTDCTGTSAATGSHTISLPRNTLLRPNKPIQPVSVIFRNQKLAAVTWDFDCHIISPPYSTDLMLVQKYDSYKQCLLHHLPSCTKPFRGLYGEKREKEILHKIIPTGERKLLSLHSSVNDNHDSQPSLWSQPQPQLL